MFCYHNLSPTFMTSGHILGKTIRSAAKFQGCPKWKTIRKRNNAKIGQIAFDDEK